MERKQKIIELRNSGKSFTEIGKIYKISRQRAQQVFSSKKVSKPRVSKYTSAGLSYIIPLEGRERNRELVRVRDNHTCQDCGFRLTYKTVQKTNSKIVGLKGKIKSLDIHHTKGLCGKKSTGYDKINELKNLVTLCHKCHYNRPVTKNNAKRNNYCVAFRTMLYSKYRRQVWSLAPSK